MVGPVLAISKSKLGSKDLKANILTTSEGVAGNLYPLGDVMIVTKKLHFTTLAIFLLIVLAACSPEPEEEPTPVPTATRPIIASRNENVEALNAAQAALQHVEFGFAPLLVEDTARVVIKADEGVEVARLTYPQQPEDPTEWPTVDSFVSAYGVRRALLAMPQVRRVALGSVRVAASVGHMAEDVSHFAAWVTFADRSRAVIDLSPLSTNFAPRHAPDRLMTDPAQIESLFSDRRSGVDLNQLQPMTVVEENGELYYLLAKVIIAYNRYEFQLYTHPVEMADPMRPMNIRPGGSVGVEIDRDEFEALQRLLTDAGPAAFEENPELLSRQGSDGQELNGVADEHLNLLWHLITKFEHRDPDPTVPTATPTVTPTPSPTPTPTSTPTPRRLPLVTS